ncbi:Uncharacterised protein [Candidatus Tiddalikarchaeum anstoanum]|nr:Uncharacterised protein [Candidatus Tiddalikarchaeum anstoanum]
MIYALIALSYLIGGLRLLFSSKFKYTVFLSMGFILLGIHYILKSITIVDSLVEIVFSVPLLIAAFLFMMAPIIFIKGDKK